MSHHNPDQYSEQSEGLEPRRLKDILFTPTQLETATRELANWIDKRALAEFILTELGHEGVPQTVENAKKVWLNIIEYDLHGLVVETIDLDKTLDR